MPVDSWQGLFYGYSVEIRIADPSAFLSTRRTVAVERTVILRSRREEKAAFADTLRKIGKLKPPAKPIANSVVNLKLPQRKDILHICKALDFFLIKYKIAHKGNRIDVNPRTMIPKKAPIPLPKRA